VLAGGAAPLLLIGWWRGISLRQPGWLPALGYAVLVILGQKLLFSALDLLGREGHLAIAYPVSLSLCMLVVTLWEIFIWRTTPSRSTLLGLAAGLAGVICLSL